MTATAEIVQTVVHNPPGEIGMTCTDDVSRTIYTSLPASETTDPYCLANPYYCQTQAIDWTDMYTLDPGFTGDVTCNYDVSDRFFVVFRSIHPLIHLALHAFLILVLMYMIFSCGYTNGF